MSIISKLTALYASITKSKRKDDKSIEALTDINPVERAIIANLSSFRDLRAGEVMIPKTEIVGIKHTITLEEIKKSFIKGGHTRMPVYRGDLDDIVGFIHVKDFIPYIGGAKNFKLSDIVRTAIYAPRSIKCVDLLATMRKKATHLAIILDEYGGTEGILVVENLVEKIVGEIRDEHEKDVQILIHQIDDHTYKVDAKANIQDVEETIGITLSEEDGEYETFGGFILSYLDRIPYKGEKLILSSGVEIEIEDVTPRKIKSTKVIIKSPSAS